MATHQASFLHKLDLKILSLNISGLRKKTKFLKHLITQNKPDIVCLQETNISDNYSKNKAIYELGVEHNRSFFNFPNNKANGTAIICISSSLKCDNFAYYDEGRTIVLDVSQKSAKFTLVNIYAPTNGTQRCLFFELLSLRIENLSNRNNLVLTGDFNITTSDMDITGISGTNRIGRPELINIINTFKIKDAFRSLFPTKIETTFENKNISRAARIDHIYVSEHFPIAHVEHIASVLNFTDHKAVNVHLASITDNSFEKTKAAHWKFNDSLLENTNFVDAIREAINANLTNSNEHNILEKFDALNIIFKRIAIKFSTVIERNRNSRLHILNDIIKAMEIRNNNNYEVLNNLKQERDDILNHKYKGAILRSKLPILQEKPCKAFLSIESCIQNSRIVKEIKDHKGEIVTDLKVIPDVFREFYENLYAYEDTDNATQDIYLKYTRKLSDVQREAIDQPVTLYELKHALKGMREEGSPGPNGLTVKFYKYFFDDLSPFLLKFVCSCFNKGYVTEYFKTSFTVLLPKDSGSPLEVKNYRPISLLNISFKILTKALANRLSPFLCDLVHPDQAAVIKGRSIQNHNHYIRDIISLANLRGDSSCIVSIDQQKAFDRVSHEWLFKVLKENNFGPNFIRWISILNNGATSKILLNKVLTSEYQLHRGVRQGDVLSPILYILTIEPLLEKIRQDISITGLHIPNKGTQKLLAFADDTNFFVNDKNSIINITRTFEQFGKASGSLININKTKIMDIGRGLELDDDTRIEKVMEIKLLGIYYENAINQTSLRNWEHLINQIESKTNKIYYKQASIFGRSILVNTFLEPKLIYPATTLDPPKEIIKTFKKNIRTFIFKGTLPCIRHNTIIQTREDGGINLHDIEAKVNSFRLKYLYKALENPREYPIPYYFLSHHLPNLYDEKPPEFYLGNLPQFYENTLNLYQSHNRVFHLSNNKTIYYNIIQTMKQPLNGQVKRADDTTDFCVIFKDLHRNKFTTPTQKQIMYRILFGITPTSEGLAKRHKRVFFCKFCSREQETETHIFYSCQNLESIKLNLIRLLRQPHNTFIDLYKGIFLNTIPFEENKDLYMIKQTLFAIYRDSIWTARNQATHKNYIFSKDQIETLFINKVKFFFRRFKENETIKQFYQF